MNFGWFSDPKVLISAFITTIVTRVGILGTMFFTPGFYEQITTDAFHHLYVGLMLAGLTFFIAKRFKTIVLGVALGLVIDEVCIFYCLVTSTSCSYWDAHNLTLILLIYSAWIVLVKFKNNKNEQI